MKAKIMQVTRKEIGRFGLRRFTMDDVAAQLGISKKTLYKIYTSKGELIHNVIMSDLQIDKEMLQNAIKQEGNWFDKLSAVLSFTGKSRINNDLIQEIKLYFPEEEEEINNFLLFQKQQIQKLLEEGLAKGEVEPWFDLDKLLLIIQELMQISSNQQTKKGGNGESLNLLEEIKKLIFFGLIKRTW